jgi:hypothetical protein
MKTAPKKYVIALSLLAILMAGFPVSRNAATLAFAQDGSRLAVTPTSLAFNYQKGGSLPANQKLSLTSSRVRFSAVTSGAA